MAPQTAFNLTPLDHQLLAMKDEDYVPHDWDELRDIIGESAVVSLTLQIRKNYPSPNSPQHGMISAP